MSKYLIGLMLFSVVTLAGCSKSDSPENPSGSPQTNASPQATTTQESDKGKIDACALLTSQEIESVQGEPLKETKGTGKSGPDFAVSQCYFGLPTASNSIIITVTHKGNGPTALDPKQFWNEKINPSTASKKEGEEREEKKRVLPEKVEALGDDAFWTGNRVGGDLYVLKGDCYFRISVGGAGDHNAKLNKSKALAAKVLNRL